MFRYTFRRWFQRPLKNKEELEARHAAIAYLNNAKNFELVTSLEESVKHMKNISVNNTVHYFVHI